MTQNKLAILLCSLVLVAIGGSAAGWITAINDVQSSRRKLTLENCNTQNEHHQNTIAELNREIEALSTPQEAAAKLSEPFIITLIESLAPYRDCNQVLKKAGL